MTARLKQTRRPRVRRNLGGWVRVATNSPVSNAQTSEWRRAVRPRWLRAAVTAAKPVPWSADLLEALVDELYVGDEVEKLLGVHLRDIDERHYAQAIVAALLLRHSWRPDDLAYILERLRLKVSLP